jgi:hypothetical protein
MRTREQRKGRGIPVVAQAIAAMVIAVVLLAPLAAADVSGPFEPNDTIPSAVGPLAAHQYYDGTIEVLGDRDYFYFYVTSAEPAKVRIELTNLGGSSGGGGEVSDVDGTILDSNATPIESISFIRQGETRDAELTLPPQKYLIEVSSREGYRDSYRLATDGSKGSFGIYSTVTARCAQATASVAALKNGLSIAKQKLQRATNRLRRAAFGNGANRLRARGQRQRAKQRVNSKRKALALARDATLPWCAIPR